MATATYNHALGKQEEQAERSRLFARLTLQYSRGRYSVVISKLSTDIVFPSAFAVVRTRSRSGRERGSLNLDAMSTRPNDHQDRREWQTYPPMNISGYPRKARQPDSDDEAAEPATPPIVNSSSNYVSGLGIHAWHEYCIQRANFERGIDVDRGGVGRGGRSGRQSRVLRKSSSSISSTGSSRENSRATTYRSSSSPTATFGTSSCSSGSLKTPSSNDRKHKEQKKDRKKRSWGVPFQWIIDEG